jgi:hypothetical protein
MTVSITMKANQQVEVVASGTFDDGSPAPLQGTPVWENLSSPTNIVGVIVDPTDPKKATIVGNGTQTGTGLVRVSSAGLDPIQINVVLQSIYATKLVVTPGTPVAQ